MKRANAFLTFLAVGVALLGGMFAHAAASRRAARPALEARTELPPKSRYRMLGAADPIWEWTETTMGERFRGIRSDSRFQANNRPRRRSLSKARKPVSFIVRLLRP